MDVYLYITPEGKTYAGHLQEESIDGILDRRLTDVVDCMTIASQSGIEIHGNLMGDLMTPLDPMRTLIKLDKDSVYQRVYTKTISGIISPNGKFLKPC